MSNNRLPDYNYQYNLNFNSEFNNQLLRAHNQGLALYDYDTDTKLYRETDTKLINPIKINFDTINNELNDKGETYNKAKQIILGLKDSINEISEDT
jgi:hypothetical protein